MGTRISQQSLRVCIFGPGPCSADWLDGLATQVPGGAQYILLGRCASGAKTFVATRAPEIDEEEPTALATRLAAKFPGDHLLLVRNDAILPPLAIARLLRALDEERVLVASPLDNIDPRLSPLPAAATSDADPATVDAACYAYGERSLIDAGIVSSLLSAWQGKQLASLRGTRTAGLIDLRTPGLRCVTLDHLYVATPDKPLRGPIGDLDPRDPQPPSPFSRLRSHVAAALAQNVSASPFGLDRKPVILHVMHGWGGGAERWVRDLAISLDAAHHLVLIARGISARRCHGEWLELHDGALSGPPLLRVALPDPIADTALSDETYRSVLAGIVRDYCIDTIVVSSLIGHSLDVLRTGLPTIAVVHDHYPLWPILHRDFGDPKLAFDPAQLAGDLRAMDHDSEFANCDPQHWQRLREGFIAALRESAATLIAPSASALANQLRLAPELRELRQAVIPHGLAAWPDNASPLPPQGTNNRLRLVIPGRLRRGKGSDLFKRALQSLQQHADILLLGSGNAGHEFFGTPRVHVVLDYARDQLPELLRQWSPDAALLLPTVAETFSYTLSELRSLGVPVIATRIGALAERIADGKTGLLIEPDADALGGIVAGLAHDRSPLARVRAGMHGLRESTLKDMAGGYRKVLDLAQGEPARYPLARVDTADLVNAELNDALIRFRAATSTLRAELADVRKESERRGEWGHALDRKLRALGEQLQAQQCDLDQRAEWARDLEKRLDARTEWATALARDIEERTQWAKNLEAELAERTRWAEQLAADNEARTRWAQGLETELEERTQWAKSLSDDVEERTRWANELQTELEERTRWAKSLSDDVEERTSWANELQTELEERTRWAESLSADVEERTQWARNLESELADRAHQIAGLDQEVVQRTRWAQQLGEQLTQLQGEFEERTEWALRLDAELRQRYEQIARLDALARDREAILASRSWRITRPIRWITTRLRTVRTALQFRKARMLATIGRVRGSLARRGLRGTVGRIAQEFRSDLPRGPELGTAVPQCDLAPFAVPTSRQPRVSIVIPVYNKIDYTIACLRSLAEHAGSVSFEVIVVDDGSTDATASQLRDVKGIRAVRNARNLGFVGSCNAGAAKARGEFVLFLNNDTVVTPGWLEALARCFDEEPQAGLVGAKLVYPDGRLQEAGGIIFNDGSGWNYGRFDDPADPRYNFRREADYCSGAAIMLRRAVFEQLGRFDERYAPAYYEDTDLAFAVRSAGLKVFYEPRATVMHFEGITSGTDTGSGTKRYQVINQEKFLAKWHAALARQPAPGTPIGRAATHRAKLRVLIIDATTPAPDQDSGSLRMVNLMRVLGSLGAQVTFMADNRAWIERYTDDIQALGVEVLTHPWVSDPVALFRERGEEFDVIVLSRHYIAIGYLELARRYARQAKLVFDTVDLHYLREQRAAELEGRAELKRQADATRAQELKIMRESDVTLVVSPVERELLAHDAPGVRVEVLSNVHEIYGCRKPFWERRDLVFVGGFQHPPNIDAAIWFVREVFPRVREQLADVRFHIIGSKITDAVRALMSDAVIVHGFVEDIAPFMDECRISIAPLRYGAGVKGKVNMAMSYGLPVVGTPMAVEGMHVIIGEDVLVADTAAGFAAAIVHLYGDEALWQTLSKNGLANVARHFSFDAAREAVLRILAD